ncbi:MAG TPA: isoprenylcysteine carboxylmethyltransferase family protein [Candidatus Bathyarchaeia archaeon]|nr:isoprenylcysteine carboxylmethyltransferase family protein [Candidatus Bathyarchaeia archaeon]
MLEWLNFSFMIFSMILFAILYSSSTMPMTKSEKRGEKAWKECHLLRIFAMIFEFFILVTMILWFWLPIATVDWLVSQFWWISFIIGLVIIIPGMILMIVGMAHAGKESHTPSKETEMYGGIYKHIRHPQTLGEMPTFIGIAFLINSWFLVLLMTVFVIIYTPIMIHFEEKDLIKRFGDPYRKYQQEVGIIFPKKWFHKKVQK